jgi:hypothetical protein
MRQRASVVAPGVGLDAGRVVLEWDLTRFAQSPGEVVASVQYPVDFGDLPLIGALPAPLVVRAEHVEWVDPFRSGTSLPLEPIR